MSVSRWLASAAFATALMAPACEKKTPELEPQNASTAADLTSPPDAVGSPTSATVDLKNRCIRPLATTAPPVPPKAANCPADTLKQRPNLPMGKVTIEGIANIAVDVEIAEPPKWTERGLMFRTEMAEDAGMLFDLHERIDHEFWMHNTCIPLDLLYIDNDGVIVGVAECAGTLDDTPLGVGCFSSFVLEVNAGWVRRHGVKPGQRVVLPPLPPNGG